MLRHTLLSIITVTSVALWAASATAQTTAPASAPQTVAVNTDDHAAKVQRLVDGACGPAPASSAPASDREIYGQCRSMAKSRAEAIVH